MKILYIQFEDGSNPYICKTKKAFNTIQRHYNLVKLCEIYGIEYWLAKEL